MLAGENLTGKNDRLIVLTNDGGMDDGSLSGHVVLTTNYDVSIFSYNLLKCVAIANGITTFRSHYNP